MTAIATFNSSLDSRFGTLQRLLGYLPALAMCIVLVLLTSTARAEKVAPQELDDVGTDEEREATREVAERILNQFDTGQFDASWSETGSHLRSVLAEDAWGPAISRSRRDLGAFRSRNLDISVFTDHLDGAKPGRHGVLFFDSSFLKGDVREKVVLALEEEKWKLAGYFVVRPQPAAETASSGSEATNQDPD